MLGPLFGCSNAGCGKQARFCDQEKWANLWVYGRGGIAILCDKWALRKTWPHCFVASAVPQTDGVEWKNRTAHWHQAVRLAFNFSMKEILAELLRFLSMWKNKEVSRKFFALMFWRCRLTSFKEVSHDCFGPVNFHFWRNPHTIASFQFFQIHEGQVGSWNIDK